MQPEKRSTSITKVHMHKTIRFQRMARTAAGASSEVIQEDSAFLS